MASVLIDAVAEERIRSADGLEIFVRSLASARRSRAPWSSIVHGFNSHSGQYVWVGRAARAAAAWRSTRSTCAAAASPSGERFYVEKFDDYVDDVDDARGPGEGRASRACRSSCSGTARAASSRASTRSSTRTSSPA